MNATIKPTGTTVDFLLNVQGTIALLTPLTLDAENWIDLHLPEDRLTHGDAVVIEHRYVHDIANGITECGLSIRHPL